MTVALTRNFFANTRGLTLKDTASVTWAINRNTNEISATSTGGAGGVTSVGLADGSTTPIYAISGSPVTTTGTLTFTLSTQAANKVFAGPTTGAAAQPTFRSLVAADIPALAYVTSVGLSDGSTTPIYTISGSPVTSSGTLTFTLATQAANLVFAGPTTGAATQPTFRALVVADLPTGIPNANLANSSLTVTAGTGLSGGGSVSLGGSVTLSLTTPVTAANGGTGQTTYAVGDLLYASTTSALSRLADVAAGSYLRSGGTNTAPTWSTTTIPNDSVLGDLWYGSAAHVISALAGNTTAAKQFLTQTGTGSVSAAPVWGTIAAGDLPANGANPTALVGLTAVNGSATTWMRSDGAPAIDQTIAPTWTASHTFTKSGGGNAAGVQLIAAVPALTFENTTGGTDAKWWDIVGSSATSLSFRAINDAQSAANTWLSVTRNGVNITAVNYGNSANIPTHTFRGGLILGGSGANKGDGTANAAIGLFIAGAAVSPSASNPPITMVTGQFLRQYQQLVLQSTDRLTAPGTARIIIERGGPDFLPGPQGEAFEGLGMVTLGRPKTPSVNFVVPTEYICDFLKRLNLVGAIRATLQGTANLVVRDDFGTRSRIVLAGTGY